MLLIREAGPKDFSRVFPLARLLDSYNLPADPKLIRKLLEDSRCSFRGLLPREKSRYLFVLEDQKTLLVPGTPVPGTNRIVGCSLILAKHGSRGRPHLWLAQKRVTKKSRTLGIRRSHEVLQLGYTENGPTEVGGLVVLPAYRRNEQGCGLQLSYARFLYMAMHPGRFEKTVLIEYRGAMGRRSRSPFWEAVGKVFTGLPYARADRLSATRKEFILSLLPREPLYCALLPEKVQKAIGAIHPNAVPAAKLAGRQGFRRMRQIEPFDGGPYYSAPRSGIGIVRATRRLQLVQSKEGTSKNGVFLVGTDSGGWFRAVRTEGAVRGPRFAAGSRFFDRLRVKPGAWAYVCRLSR